MSSREAWGWRLAIVATYAASATLVSFSAGWLWGRFGEAAVRAWVSVLATTT